MSIIIDHHNFRPRRVTFSAALCVLAVGLSSVAHAQTPPDGPTPDRIVSQMHHGFETIGKELGGLTDDEKAGMQKLESKVADDLKTNPDKAKEPSFRDDTLKQFREVLTPEHQKRFDAVMVKMRQRMTNVKNLSTLHQLGLMNIMYSNDHGGKTAPDLGSLAAAPDATPGSFLTADSKVKPPADWDKMDAKAKGDWVNKNTDFVYLSNSTEMTAVVAYIKPEATTGDNAFLLNDGSVQGKSSDESKPIIEELKAGKNPPPSLK